MHLDDINRLLFQFRTTHGWRYRYIKKTWFAFTGEEWAHLDALPLMQQSLIGIADVIFPPKHKAQGQLGQAYMLRAMEIRLRPYLTSETLPRDPFQNRIDDPGPDLQ